jgi:hypothetical protein
MILIFKIFLHKRSALLKVFDKITLFLFVQIKCLFRQTGDNHHFNQKLTKSFAHKPMETPKT